MSLGLLVLRVLIAVAFALAGAGPGAWSLDHALGPGRAGADWAIGALLAGLLGGGIAVISGRWQARLDQRHEQHAGVH